MKTILAFDTSGPSLSVALTVEDRLIYECTRQNGLTHSEGLMPLIDAALDTAKLTPAQVDCFAVTHGPGSFTGVRIGVETAKALAHATGRACIGISALEALAAGCGLFDGTVCPLQDARAEQVYCAAFRHGEQIHPDAALKLADFLALLAGDAPCCFVGDGAVRYRTLIEDTLGPRAVFPPPGEMMVRAANVAYLASGRPGGTVSWPALQPYYLRAPQAERERLARQSREGAADA